MLANELAIFYKYTVDIIPFVITWGGISTIYNKRFCEEINVTDRVFAYIQTIALKKTMESISLDFRRRSGSEEEGMEEKETLLN